MAENLVPIAATGVFTLAGVLLSAVLERWRSREKRLQTVFDKQVEAYTDLVRQTHKILVKCMAEHDEHGLVKDGMQLLDGFGDCALFSSAEVSDLALGFALAAARTDLEIKEKRDELGTLHRELRRRCQEELGMAEL